MAGDTESEGGYLCCLIKRRALTDYTCNEAGQDSRQVRVTYLPLQAPTVAIQSPADGAVFRQANITLRATIDAVEQASGITLRLNGRSITNFSFDGRNLRADLQLQPRSNTIEVTARNEAGQDSKQIRVTYTPPQPPTVAILKPADGEVYGPERQRTWHVEPAAYHMLLP